MTRESEVRALVQRVVDEALGAATTPSEAIAIGSDHGGFQLKTALVEHLRGRGFTVEDCGCSSTAAVDPRLTTSPPSTAQFPNASASASAPRHRRNTVFVIGKV